jgi:hypothetical protein
VLSFVTLPLYSLLAAHVVCSTGFELPDDTQTTTESSANFAAPVRLMAGDAYLGEYRMYPSPALHDWNGDGRLDVVIGDLPGRVTVALRAEDGSLGSDERVKGRDGELLDFGNW